MGKYVVLAGIFWSSAVFGGSWEQLNQKESEQALVGTSLKYDNATQVFYASGRTLYDEGRESWGYWRVEGDRYCSQWPPADGWACYTVARRTLDGSIKFIGDSGAEAVGKVTE